MGYAVVLINTGGPTKEEEVRPYLTEFFSDSLMMQFPFGSLYQKTLAKMIAKRRSPFLINKFKQIGSFSPLNQATQQLAQLMNERLNQPVYWAVRYGEPSIAHVLTKVFETNPEGIIFLPLFPQYCIATTGSIKHQVEYTINTNLISPNGKPIPTYWVEHYYQNPHWIKYGTTTLKKALDQAEGNPYLLFVAHSLPLSYVKKGDPYIQQCYKTVRFFAESLPKTVTYSLAFQSKLGPIPWQGPLLKEALDSILHQGFSQLIVMPISFSLENLETLFDLDYEFKNLALQKGIQRYYRLPTPGMSEEALQCYLDNIHQFMAHEDHHA